MTYAPSSVWHAPRRNLPLPFFFHKKEPFLLRSLNGSGDLSLGMTDLFKQFLSKGLLMLPRCRTAACVSERLSCVPPKKITIGGEIAGI